MEKFRTFRIISAILTAGIYVIANSISSEKKIVIAFGRMRNGLGNNYGKKIIYKATNIINNKSYIGQTTQELKKRISDHIYEAFKRLRKDPFHSAIREFGIEAFNFSIVRCCYTHKQLYLAEREEIIKANTIENGYNTQIRKDRATKKTSYQTI